MNRSRFVEVVWYESYMPVFLERFVLPVLAAAVITVIVLNPFKWDWQQRLSLFLGLLFIAYFVGHTINKSRTLGAQTNPPVAPAQPLKINGNASATGDHSVANTGDGNTINESSPPEKKPPKKE